MTPLVLLHGFTGTPRSWDALRTSRGTTPTLLGHSPETLDLPVATFSGEVDRLAQIIARDGTGQRLCGYSLGGRVALGLLVRHPELFARATLIGAHPGLDSEEERADRVQADERWCALLEREGLEGFVDQWERLPLFASQARLPQAIQRAQREERLRHSAVGLVQSLRVTGLGRMPSYWPALETITIPVTLMIGELDTTFVRLAKQTAARLPNARLVVVPGTGHNVVLERPDAVAAELER